MVDTACAVIAPGQVRAPATPTDINTFHCTCGYTHEVLLKKTVEQQELNLSREFHECLGCSMAKGLRKPIARSMHTRAGALFPSRDQATAPYYRRGGVYNGGGRGRGGRVKSRWREDRKFGQRVRPRHDGGVAPGATCNVRGASGRTWSRGRRGVEGNPPTPSVSRDGRFLWHQRQQ